MAVSGHQRPHRDSLCVRRLRGPPRPVPAADLAGGSGRRSGRGTGAQILVWGVGAGISVVVLDEGTPDLNEFRAVWILGLLSTQSRSRYLVA